MTGDGPVKSGEDGGLRAVALAVIGLCVGAALGRGPWGPLSGLAIGWLVGGLWTAREQSRRLSARMDRLDRRVRELETTAAPAAAPAAPGVARAVEPEPSGVAAATVPEAVRAVLSAPAPSPLQPAGSQPVPTPATPKPPPAARASADPFERGLGLVRDLIFGGNTVVRVGVLVLLVGVSLLAKYAVDHAVFPIELRLAAASLIGVALTVVGYRQRAARPGFADALQGGGVAALYLVVFFAYRRYGLVPPGLAFALFAGIAAGGAGLAVLQRAQPLAVIGSLGGFLAPVLASTGEGNHVALFGFYLLLDVAIVAIAWFRAWRALNVLAFVCTYGVATAWGVLRYEPEHFASTEPFLLAFLALFTAVAVLFAWRRPPQLRGLVDGTLVFGVPLMTLLFQTRLVAETELGLAVSSAGFGLFYAGLATALWRRAPVSLRPLCEAFAALAVGFGTMAIPFGFDDALTTGIAWALEGAGLYWVGARQERGLSRLAGAALQPLAAIAFGIALASQGAAAPDAPFLVNGRFLSCLALALAGLFIAREAEALGGRVSRREARASQLFAAWGLCWWAAGALREIDRFAAPRFAAASVVGWIAGSGVALEAAAAASRWRTGRLLALAMLPAGFLALPYAIEHTPHVLAGGGLLAWPLLLTAIYGVLGRLESDGPRWLPCAYAPALWLVAAAAAVALAGLADRVLDVDGDWPLAGFGLGLGGVLWAAVFAVERRWRAFGRHFSLQLRWGVTPVAGLGLLWSAVASLAGRGDSAPLPYLPILNPVDAVTALVLVAILGAWACLLREDEVGASSGWRRWPAPLLAAAGFVWLNAILARSVHQWTGVRFRLGALWDSVPLQVSLSIAWTLLALVGMLAASRRRRRTGWIAAACLLGTVVVKLFVVDLSQLSTVAKIGTFLVVGVLLLVVGYLSPVPPGVDEGSGPGAAGREVT